MRSWRERIIVLIALIAVAWYIGDYFYSKAGVRSAYTGIGAVQGVEGFIARINDELRKSGLSPAEKEILKRLAANGANPFLKNDPLVDTPSPKVEKPAVILPSYTGYLRIGDRQIGILDGMEYEQGERIVDTGFTVLAIAPDHVLVRGNDAKIHTIRLSDAADTADGANG